MREEMWKKRCSYVFGYGYGYVISQASRGTPARYLLKGARSAAVATRPWGGLLPCSPRSPAALARPSRAACLELQCVSAR